jgi:hypothetical protein
LEALPALRRGAVGLKPSHLCRLGTARSPAILRHANNIRRHQQMACNGMEAAVFAVCQ